MAYGLAHLVSLRFLSESLVIEAIYSITNSGVPLESWGPSYSENVYAGTHPRLSMGDPYPIDLWKRSRPVRECVPRHSVSWHLVPQSGAWLILIFFQHSQSHKKPSPEWTGHGVFHLCLRNSHSHHSDDLGFISDVVRVLLRLHPRSYWHMPKILPINSIPLNHCKSCMDCLARVTSYRWVPHYGYVAFPTRQGWDKCDFHIVFLARALLKSRSGFEKSDSVVNYLTRQVIQIGLFANLSVIAGLATWFLLPKASVFLLFDLTLGPVYTHVSVYFLQILSNIYTNDV